MAKTGDRERKLARVRKARELLSNCVPATVAADAIAQEYEVSVRTAWDDLARAREEFREANSKLDLETYIPQAVVLAERHYLRCAQAGQLGTGLGTLKWLAELHGYQPAPLIKNTVKAQVTTGAGPQWSVDSMSDQEIERRLDELRELQG